MAKTTVPKLQVTKNYRLFKRSVSNRPIDEKKHRRLKVSMETYGFLDAFPIVCSRNGDKQLEVRDGQHRLLFAESLNLPVYYIVTEQEFRIADVNSTAKTWVLADYAKNYAENGSDDYRELIEFHESYGMPFGTCAAMLAGTVSFTNINEAFITGTFQINDREWAHRVATVYKPLTLIDKRLRSSRLIEACMAACRVEWFDIKRMLQNAERCREKLVPYSTRDAYLDMLEDVYNFGRKQLMGLKAASIMAMRERNAAVKWEVAKEKKSK